MLTWLMGCSAMACAHTCSTAYLELALHDTGANGEWLLDLRDLERAVGVDANQDGRISWGELQAREAALIAYAQMHFRGSTGAGDAGVCAIDLGSGAPVTLDGNVFWRWPLQIRCPQAALSQLTYSVLFASDSSHRALVKIRSDKAGDEQLWVFSPQQPHWFIDTDQPLRVLDLIPQGVIHILEGYDHLLFLLALLVPILLAHRTELVSAKKEARTLIADLLKVITAFTIGHSVTLAIATLGGWAPPSHWVEAAIAATVIVAGINIARPLFLDASWRMAAVFGLIHGFGFATVLGELSLPREQLALSLLNFNLGVEAGQLLVVAVVCPLFFALARVRTLAISMRVGSALVSVGIGSVWLVQRTLL